MYKPNSQGSEREKITMNIHMSRERVLEPCHTEAQASLPSTFSLVSNLPQNIGEGEFKVRTLRS